MESHQIRSGFEEQASVAVIPTPQGCAVHSAGGSRLLPWPIARDLLDDPTLVLHSAALDGLSPWDHERLLAALLANDPQARILLEEPWPPERLTVQALPRHPRRWHHLVDLGVIAGDLEAACCRAGLALPGDDVLAQVTCIATLMARHHEVISVRDRLRADHPWVADAAWLAGTGRLAETVVLHGQRLQAEPIQSADVAIAEILGDITRFTAQREDVRMAMRSITDGRARWNERGHVSLRPAGGWQVRVAQTDIGLGIGGLHSHDPAGVLDGPLWDLDVISYYPSIIAREGIHPAGFPDFPARVGTLMQRRLDAKRRGDAAASQALKLVINSLYGQLGNPRSSLFAPRAALHVVLTGQLRLFELIDGILAAGGELISANTDGIVVRGQVDQAARVWEERSGFTLERRCYDRLWRTSINDYVARDAGDGSVKTKGRFGGGEEGDAEATRRSSAPIIARAAVEHLVHGRPITACIADADQVVDFTHWRHARDLSWNGRPLHGRVVRWIISPQGHALVQKTKGHPTTVAAHAVLVDDPTQVRLADIDRSWYANESQSLVDKIMGTQDGSRQLSLLDQDNF